MKLTTRQINVINEIGSTLSRARRFHVHLDGLDILRGIRSGDSPLTGDLRLAERDFAKLVEEIQNG